jgi:hypothetical protein
MQRPTALRSMIVEGGGEQRGPAVALVVVDHRRRALILTRSPGWERSSSRIWLLRQLEPTRRLKPAQRVWLQAMRLPDLTAPRTR